MKYETMMQFYVLMTIRLKYTQDILCGIVALMSYERFISLVNYIYSIQLTYITYTNETV